MNKEDATCSGQDITTESKSQYCILTKGGVHRNVHQQVIKFDTWDDAEDFRKTFHPSHQAQTIPYHAPQHIS